MEKDISKLSDEELVEIIGNAFTGPTAERAKAELNRRLIKSINQMNRSMSFYSERIMELTIVILSLAFLQLLTSLNLISGRQFLWLFVAAIVVILMYHLVSFLWKKKVKVDK